MIRVAHVMSRRIVTVSPSDSVEDAARLMRRHACEYLPVRHRGRVVGILGRGDVVETSPDVVSRRRIEAVMAREVVTVRPQTPLAEAARLMRDWRTPALPVVAHERLVGILTDSMLNAYLADLVDDAARPRRPRRAIV
jgi:CBS domain-containing protein